MINFICTYCQYLIKVERKKQEEDRKVFSKLLITRAKNAIKLTPRFYGVNLVALQNSNEWQKQALIYKT